MDVATQFRRIADRLRSIEAPDDYAASGEIAKHAALACRNLAVIAPAVPDSHPLAAFKAVPFPSLTDRPERPDVDDGQWLAVWLLACKQLQQMFPVAVPRTCGSPRCESMGEIPVQVFQSQDWRSRAADFADVCEFVAELTNAELAEDGPKPPPPSGENQNAASGATRVPQMNADAKKAAARFIRRVKAERKKSPSARVHLKPFCTEFADTESISFDHLYGMLRGNHAEWDPKGEYWKPRK